jgi:2-polyprenyl-3-methyl-5-hydroxy-6-metoxy-1,4-benzoquinol methylase
MLFCSIIMNFEHIIEKEKNWKKNFPVVYKSINFSKYLKNSQKHLDFGCGFGIFTYLLAKKHPKTLFYGTDIDKEMIKVAKKKYHLKNLLFDPNLASGFDSISCIYVLHHVTNQKSTLKKLIRKLNNKGLIFILEFKKTPINGFSMIYDKNNPTMSFEEYYRIHNKWTKEQFEQICKDTGLKTLLLKDYGDFWFIYIGEKQL